MSRASAYAPGIGTAAYCCSPGAAAVKLFWGGEVVVGEWKAPCPILGVAERALLGGACNLKLVSAAFAGPAWLMKEDGGSAIWGPGVKLGASEISEKDL